MTTLFSLSYDGRQDQIQIYYKWYFIWNKLSVYLSTVAFTDNLKSFQTPKLKDWQLSVSSSRNERIRRSKIRFNINTRSLFIVTITKLVPVNLKSLGTLQLQLIFINLHWQHLSLSSSHEEEFPVHIHCRRDLIQKQVLYSL